MSRKPEQNCLPGDTKDTFIKPLADSANFVLPHFSFVDIFYISEKLVRLSFILFLYKPSNNYEHKQISNLVQSIGSYALTYISMIHIYLNINSFLPVYKPKFFNSF